MGYGCKIILSLIFVFDFIFEYQYMFLRLFFAYPACGNFCFDFFSKNHLGNILLQHFLYIKPYQVQVKSFYKKEMFLCIQCCKLASRSYTHL